MKFFMPLFKSEALFLTRYFLIQSSFCVLVLFLFNYFNFTPSLNLSLIEICILLPIAFVVGIKLPAIMHNCFHNNLKRFNFAIGELTSFFVLMGFGILCINHTFHHAYADTKKDPHAPDGKSFFMFFATCIFSGVSIIENYFLETHGRTRKNILIFKLNIILHYVGIALRLACWYTILGPQLFLFFYIPAFSVYLFTFAHVNYVTHQRQDDGSFTVVNFNSNPWHKLVNYIGDGIYFHENHHAKPSVFNPRSV